jgi:hypothetical protein
MPGEKEVERLAGVRLSTKHRAKAEMGLWEFVTAQPRLCVDYQAASNLTGMSHRIA